MPITVNGELVPKELVRAEASRLRAMPDWQQAATRLDDIEFGVRLRQGAEQAAIDKVLIVQELRKDARPLDPEVFNRELEHAKSQAGCRPGFDETALRRQVEATLRYRRTVQDISGNVAAPPLKEVRDFYDAYRENFRAGEMVTASHIIKHVDQTRPEEAARAGIEEALEALRAGESFASVATRLSECPDNGGNLGSFERGIMVQEFDDVVFALQPGQRSGIFRTPFGFQIAEVRANTKDGIAPFEHVRPDIESALKLMKEHEGFTRGMAVLRSRADIRCVSQEEADRLAATRAGAI